MKGESYSELMDVITHKTKYSYFCANCNRGPFYTSASRTDCPACASELTLTLTQDGDIVVEVTKTKR